MKSISDILEGLLDDNFDVAPADINPLTQAFMGAEQQSYGRCYFPHDQYVKMWQFIRTKGLPESNGCKKIPKSKLDTFIDKDTIVGIWDETDDIILFYCNEYFYDIGPHIRDLILNIFKCEARRSGANGWVAGINPVSFFKTIKKHKCACYSIPYELMKKLMDTIKVPFSKA